MLDKKNNSSIKSRLSEKELFKMKKEIQELEEKIKNLRISNAKINALKGLKLSLEVGKKIAPVIVTTGLAITTFSLTGTTPFYRDNWKVKLNDMKEFDSKSNIGYEEQYDDYGIAKYIVSYYGKWKSLKDGSYSRDVVVYLDVNSSGGSNYTKVNITKLVNENRISALQELLGEPILTKTETKTNLTEEELESDPFLEIIESREYNIESTVEVLLITAVGGGLMFAANNYSLTDFKKNLENEYPTVDTKELTRKLKLKKSDYKMSRK